MVSYKGQFVLYYLLSFGVDGAQLQVVRPADLDM